MAHILIYSPDAGTALGHAFMYAARVCEQEVRMRQDVVLLTSPGFEAKYRRAYGKEPEFTILEKTHCDFSTTMLASDFWGKIYRGWRRIVYGLRMNRELVVLLKSRQFDIMHWLDDPEIFSTLWFARKVNKISSSKRKMKWFVNLHPGDISLRGHAGDTLRALYKAFTGFGLKTLINSGLVAGFFVHGDWIRDSLISRWHFPLDDERIVVAPYGADEALASSSRISREEARATLGLPRDNMVALAFGVIRRDKGIDDIIRAVSMVRGITLLVAGKPTSIRSEEIRQLVERAGIADRTVLNLSYIPEEKIHIYFSAADVMITCHKKSFPGQSGLVHLGCTYRVPLVASNVGAVGEFVCKNGIGEVFPPGDPRALSELLRHFQEMEADCYENYRERLHRTSHLFSWKVMVERYLQAYRIDKR